MNTNNDQRISHWISDIVWEACGFDDPHDHNNPTLGLDVDRALHGRACGQVVTATPRQLLTILRSIENSPAHTGHADDEQQRRACARAVASLRKKLEQLPRKVWL